MARETIATGLTLLLGVGLSACSGGAAEPHIQTDGGLAGSPGTVTVEVVDRLGGPIAGLEVVFHDAAGQTAGIGVTDDHGLVGQIMEPGGGVTLIEVDPHDRHRELQSALALPTGPEETKVRFVSIREPLWAPLVVEPRLPPLDIPGVIFRVSMVCPDFVDGATTLGDEPLEARSTCIRADGTYSLEAVAEARGGTMVAYSSLSGIPAGDLSPTLPAWRTATRDYRWDFVHLDRFTQSVAARDAEGRTRPGRFNQLGDEVYRADPTGLDGDTLVHLDGVIAGAKVSVDRYLPGQPAERARIDLEGELPRAPRAVRVATESGSAVVSWSETTVGLSSRFVAAKVEWDLGYTSNSIELAASGTWRVVQPTGERRLVLPELPEQLRNHRPPVARPDAHVTAEVTLMDETAFASYAALLAAAPLAPAGLPTPVRDRDHVIRTAVATSEPATQGAAGATAITLVTEPPASALGVVHVAAGTPLTLAATGAGGSVTWTQDHDGAALDIDGPTAVLHTDSAGADIVVTAASAADPRTAAQVLVRIGPPPCRESFPPIHPRQPLDQLSPQQRFPMAVKRDGTPVVAYLAAADRRSPAQLHVVAWSGSWWADLGDPLPIQPLALGSPPAALVLDGEDRPIVAIRTTADEVQVKRFEGGAWVPLTTPLARVGAGDLVLALDPAGRPVTARAENGPSDRSVWVSRWRDGAWVEQRVFQDTGRTRPDVAIRSMVMDGDVPTVMFEQDMGAGRPTIRTVEVAASPIDLGPADTGSMGFLDPAPTLALPAAGQPVLVWLDAASREVGSGLVARATQLRGEAWETYAEPLSLPAGAGPHAVARDGDTARLTLATVGDDPWTVELHELGRDNGLLCPPLTISDDGYGGGAGQVGSLGMATDPTGGQVVGLALSDGTAAIAVQRVRPAGR